MIDSPDSDGSNATSTANGPTYECVVPATTSATHAPPRARTTGAMIEKARRIQDGHVSGRSPTRRGRGGSGAGGPPATLVVSTSSLLTHRPPGIGIIGVGT